MYCKVLGCHRWLFIIVILSLKPTWNVQVYSHKNTVLRDKGQGDVALWMKYHRISQD